MANEDVLRTQLVKLLDFEEAHVGFARATKGIPSRVRGAVPDGAEHSAWQLIEHLRIAQADILEFCRSPKYREKKWPDDYWPRSSAPRNAEAWRASLTGYVRDRTSMQRLAANTTIDLFATIPHGTGQTYFREILLAADHASYHIGQLVALRRRLGVWP